MQRYMNIAKSESAFLMIHMIKKKIVEVFFKNSIFIVHFFVHFKSNIHSKSTYPNEVTLNDITVSKKTDNC